MDARVTSEQRTYSREAPRSFFRDQALAQWDPDARDRLEAHMREVEREMELRSPEGLRAEREYEQHYRADSGGKRPGWVAREVRAASTATVPGFTTPQWIVSEWAKYRGTRRTFADQCRLMPMPAYGMTINVPRFNAASSAGVQTEGGAVTELDPTGVDNSEDLKTIAGQITASQQLFDRTRGAPDGPSFDTILYAQIRDSYDQSLNNYALARAMALGAQVAGASSFSLANFYQDLAVAREKLQDTAGVRLQASHVFTTPDLYGFATRQVDDQHRPLIVPGYAPGQPLFSTEDGHDGWDQFTGTVLPGVLMWFVDATIPAAGSNTQVVVSRPDKVLLWESEPVARAFPQTVANQLQVVAQLYSYAACVPQYPGATATITGNGYATTLV